MPRGSNYLDRECPACSMLTFSRRIYNTFNFYSEVEGSDNTFRWFLVVAGFRLGHHHLAELIKVHGAGAVLQTTDHLLFFCWLAEKLSNFVGCYLVQLLFVCLFVLLDATSSNSSMIPSSSSSVRGASSSPVTNHDQQNFCKEELCVIV